MHAWLLRILTNSYISDYRKKRRQPVHCSTEEFTEQRLLDSYSGWAPAVLRSAEDQALDSLPDNDIKSAMQALPQQFRDVVYYADVAGLHCQESRRSWTRRPELWLRSFTAVDDDCAGCSATPLAVPEPKQFPATA